MPYDRRVSGSRWKRHRWVQKWLSKRFCVCINYWFERMGLPHEREVNPLKWQYLPFCRLSTVYWIRKLNPNHIAVAKRNMLILLYNDRLTCRPWFLQPMKYSRRRRALSQVSNGIHRHLTSFRHQMERPGWEKPNNWFWIAALLEVEMEAMALPWVERCVAVQERKDVVEVDTTAS
jgi:hypothetical protein